MPRILTTFAELGIYDGRIIPNLTGRQRDQAVCGLTPEEIALVEGENNGK